LLLLHHQQSLGEQRRELGGRHAAILLRVSLWSSAITSDLLFSPIFPSSLCITALPPFLPPSLPLPPSLCSTPSALNTLYTMIVLNDDARRRCVPW
jgi:hypothetical protein